MLLITGARGFIGSHLVKAAIDSYDGKIIAFIRNTNQSYAVRLDTDKVSKAVCSGKLAIHIGDLNGDISGLCEGVTDVIHCAAKTFVDHSIKDPIPFVQANTLGTANLLEEARRQKVKRFIHVSTDEVYGQILEGSYAEDAPLNPRNPYAASKAAADCLVQSYYHTFGMWTIVSRTENNYGPLQHHQKAIPTFINKAIHNMPLPVYGDGMHVRQWLHVLDHVQGLLLLLKNAKDIEGGSIWHIAGNQEITNYELASKILTLVGRPRELIKFIPDHNIRPGHDRRYALSFDKITKLGWKPTIDLDTGIQDLIDSYQSL